MIDSKDISVVVQGYINQKETPKCLKSIRKYLPDAEIILSTWDDSDVSELDYDILVTSPMPDAVVLEVIKSVNVYNNMNRQLISTQAGLKQATRKYVMKFRSDLILTSDKFLQYFDMFQERSGEYCLFKRKMLTSTLSTRFEFKTKNDDKRYTPFHVSDWWFFGLREDLNKYFLETPQAVEPNFTNYFTLENNINKKTPYDNVRFKFSPEQYFCYECFARNFDDIFMEDAADFNDDIIEKSRKCIVNNFIVLEFEQSGIYLKKYYYSKHEKYSGDQYTGLYNFYRYESEYKRYCDSSYSITDKNILFENVDKSVDLLRIYKHIGKLYDPSISIIKKIEQLLIGIPIAYVSYGINCLTGKYQRNNKT